MASGTTTVIKVSGGIRTPIVSDASALPQYFETKDLFLESLDVVKFVQRIRTVVRDLSTANLEVIFRGRNKSEGVYVDSDRLCLTCSDTSIRVRGAKLIRVRFESTSPLTRWLFSQFELLGQLGGRRDL